MAQAHLFDPQPAMTEGERRKEHGTRKVESVVDLAWRRRMEAAREHFHQIRKQFTADHLLEFAGHPDHPNATGAVIRAWSRKGLIRRVGSAQGTRPEQHAREVKVWEAL